jgi:dipeptidyl aminopeptidase/acylaminoacyl peptidase
MTVKFEKREAGNLVTEGVPEIPAEINEKLTHYENIREAVVVDWLMDGVGMLINTRFGESAQLHLVEKPGGARRQLTFFNEPIFSATVRPTIEDPGFVFAKDLGGNEVYQLYYYDLNSGAYYLLTDGNSRHGLGVWSNSGEWIAYSSTKRNQTDYDLYLCRPARVPGEKLLFEGRGYWYPVQWSPDDRWITVVNYHSINECYLYCLEVDTGILLPVTATEGVACQGGAWDKTGSGIFFTSDEDSQFRQLYYFEMASGTRKRITTGIEWDVEQLSLSPDGNSLAFTVNEAGLGRLFILDTRSWEYRKIENIPDGQIDGLKWRSSGKMLAITLNSPVAPADAYVLDFLAGNLTRWTFSEAGGLKAADFVAPSLIHFQTFDFDGYKPREIPAFYFRPRREHGPFPVLIYIHGGPESQFRPSFFPVFQYYLKELNIAVLAPNVRGSTGYGKNYLRLDDGYKREDAVQDIGRLLDWIAEQPELDSARIAVIGGSYGGYMTLASMTHFNDRLCCGVDIVGISNFVTFLENTKSYRRDLRRVEYGDERDPQMRLHLERISPTTNAHKITKPMLIVQGLNDPRVPAGEAEQMLRAIRRNGGEAWYLLAKDEGHGFRKKSNRDYYNKAVILFLQRYLLGYSG